MKIGMSSIQHIISLVLALPILVISFIAGIDCPTALVPGRDLVWLLVLPQLLGSAGIVVNALIGLVRSRKTA